MSKNRTPGASAANSFRADEIRAALELFAILDRGGDPRFVLRSAPLRNVRRKFGVMDESLARQTAASTAAPLRSVEGGKAR